MIRHLIKRYMGQAESGEANLPDTGAPMDVAEEWDATDEATRAQLIDALYPQLKGIAQRQMSRERQDHTLQPTALVNEFFLILARQKRFTVNGKAHFLAIASRAMRRLLIDHARSRNAECHGGNAFKVQLDGMEVRVKEATFDMMQLEELLERLNGEEPRMAKVVELKLFGGLTFAEIAQVLPIDERTAKRDWSVARAWLIGHLKREEPDAG